MAQKGLGSGPRTHSQEVAEPEFEPSAWPQSPALGHCAVQPTPGFLPVKGRGTRLPHYPCYRWKEETAQGTSEQELVWTDVRSMTSVPGTEWLFHCWAWGLQGALCPHRGKAHVAKMSSLGWNPRVAADCQLTLEPSPCIPSAPTSTSPSTATFPGLSGLTPRLAGCVTGVEQPLASTLCQITWPLHRELTWASTVALPHYILKAALLYTGGD